MASLGGDEAVALAGLLAAWGRDWAAARRCLVTLLVAGGRVGAASRVLHRGDVVPAGDQSVVAASGWKCPACGGCYAPTTAECLRCNAAVGPSTAAVNATFPNDTNTLIDPRTAQVVEQELRHRYVRGQ